jgi:hypothetical protein
MGPRFLDERIAAFEIHVGQIGAIDGKGRAWSRAAEMIDLADGMAPVDFEERTRKTDLAAFAAMVARSLPSFQGHFDLFRSEKTEIGPPDLSSETGKGAEKRPHHMPRECPSHFLSFHIHILFLFCFPAFFQKGPK